MVKTATVRNVRLVTELNLALDPEVTVFHGRTGTGKTTVLDALVTGLAPVQRKGRAFQKRDFSNNWEPEVSIETHAGSRWRRCGVDPTRTLLYEMKSIDARTAVAALSGAQFNAHKPRHVPDAVSQPDQVAMSAARSLFAQESAAPLNDDPARWSRGHAKIIAIMTSIARALCLSTGRSTERWQDSAGVAVIDDIDANLHPGLHQRIIPAIRTTFPNVQIITSTHSALILTTVQTHQIVELSYRQPKVTATPRKTSHPSTAVDPDTAGRLGPTTGP